MRNIRYQAVSSLEEGLSCLSQYGEKAAILGGGTNLLAMLHYLPSPPEILLDLKGIQEMARIRFEPSEGLTIGAFSTIRSLETSSLIRDLFPAISEAASSLASIQIRNRATLGGNLCNASPFAEMAPGMICLGAQLRIVSVQGERWLPLEEFFTGSGKNALSRGELLTEVRIPPPPPRFGCRYARHSIRRAMDLPIIGVAVALRMGATQDICADIRIALGAAGPMPMRARNAETRLRGQRIDPAALAETAVMASREASPLTNVRATAAYRSEMIQVVTRRVLRQVWEEIS